MCSSVDLPQPDGPTSATSSLCLTASETPRSTSSRTAPCAKLRLTPLRTSTSLLRSLIAQGLHRVEPRCTPSGIERCRERKRQRQRHDERYLSETDDGRNLGQEINDAPPRQVVLDAGEPAADALHGSSNGEPDRQADDGTDNANGGAAEEENAQDR